VSTTYKFLILEDVETDVELIMDQIKEAGINCSFKSTDNERDFKKLIDEFKPDLVLSDYSLPAYDGMSALSYILKTSPNLPVIIVTGSINEETAVSCMKSGAADYILKDNMSRLGLAVLAALEKKTLKMQIIQAQKMEAIGTLAGGIAHDFNNLLGIIIGYSENMLNKLDKEDEMYKFTSNIKEAGMRGAELTDQLLSFSRKQVIQTELISINTVIEETEKMLGQLLGEDIELISQLEPKLWFVEADRGQINQIVMNLSINARDAMTAGGKIVMRTDNITIDKEYCNKFPYAIPGEFICMSVEDEGSGMDHETMSHIFEPFFTTKGTGRGTGLGLSVIYGIVKQHGGWVNVESVVGRGSTFRVFLPAVLSPGIDKSMEKTSTEDLDGHGKRVLLVEDEKMLREFTSKTLTENGYTVFGAGKAEEARVLFEREQGQFDIILSDVVLPDTDGITLVDSLLLQKPKLKVIITSGYMDDKSQWPVIQEKGYPFLKKPYSLHELLKGVRTALKQISPNDY